MTNPLLDNPEARACANKSKGKQIFAFPVFDVGDFESARNVTGMRLIRYDYRT